MKSRIKEEQFRIDQYYDDLISKLMNILNKYRESAKNSLNDEVECLKDHFDAFYGKYQLYLTKQIEKTVAPSFNGLTTKANELNLTEYNNLVKKIKIDCAEYAEILAAPDLNEAIRMRMYDFFFSVQALYKKSPKVTLGNNCNVDDFIKKFEEIAKIDLFDPGLIVKDSLKNLEPVKITLLLLN